MSRERELAGPGTATRLLASVAVLVLLAACSEQAAPTASSPSPSPAAAAARGSVSSAVDKVTILDIPVTADAPLFVAIERGYFTGLGIDIDYQLSTSAAQTLSTLAAGQADVASNSLSVGLFSAAARGINLRIVATLAPPAPETGPATSQIVLSKPLWDSGEVRSIADLKGKKVAIPGPGGNGEYTLMKTLQQHGMTPADVDVTPLSYPDTLVALSTGAVAAGQEGEPFITQGLEKGALVLAPDPKDQNPLPGKTFVYLFMNSTFMSQRSEVASRFMRGFVRGVRDVENGKDRDPAVLEIVNKYTKVPIEVQQKLPPGGMYSVSGLASIDPAFIADFQEVFIKSGALLQEKPLPAEQIVDTTLTRAAIAAP